MDSYDDDSCDIKYTPPEILESTANVSLYLLPENSRKKYEIAYEKFMDWRQKNNVQSFSEKVVLLYFVELSQTLKASTLWSHYSMLRSTLSVKHNVDLSTYSRLRAFLKRKFDKHTPKKSKTLTSDEIHRFLNFAPDEKYLLTKVALAIGLTGACRREELWKLKIDHLQDLNTALLVKIINKKTRVRTFTITGEFYNIYKKYACLRPANAIDRRFFLNYQGGKCTKQVVGINKFGGMAKQIAMYLKLPNPELYTGHCFRRSSATISVNAGEHLEDSIANQIEIANQIGIASQIGAAAQMGIVGFITNHAGIQSRIEIKNHTSNPIKTGTTNQTGTTNKTGSTNQTQTGVTNQTEVTNPTGITNHMGITKQSGIVNQIEIANDMQISNSMTEPIEPSVDPFAEVEDPQYHEDSQSSISSSPSNITMAENVLKKHGAPGITFNNCSKVTINYNFK